MEDTTKSTTRLISCDLNGTLVHQHTMMDMIKVYFPHMPERYEKAKDAFSKQTSGLLSMKEAFEVAGPLTKGLSLRNAIDYAHSVMRFLEGFEVLISVLYDKEKYFVINSTGYSVTTEVIKTLYGPEKVYAVICNRLIFGWEGSPAGAVEESYLCELVSDYFQGGDKNNVYDKILATGEVELGIEDEENKATLLFNLAKELNIPRTAIAHIGDTMGDSAAICEVARHGGLGVAFNYNDALRIHLDSVLAKEKLAGRIILVEPKRETSSLQSLFNVLLLNAS